MFVGNHETDFNLNKDEVEEVRFISMEDLDKEISEHPRKKAQNGSKSSSKNIKHHFNDEKKYCFFSAFLTGSLFLPKRQVYLTLRITLSMFLKAGNPQTTVRSSIFSPTSQMIGAITISEYHDLPLPKEEVKKFILALYQSHDEEKKVKKKRARKG